ncbi:protein FAM162A [Bufo gargarizans]|uniref:protein FAM162A n=1 Tax=Bufo gargarizans TaxID=30331 RepID=UPI001CF5D70D|nr:protein FAM162A [Bufo gargarizans]
MLGAVLRSSGVRLLAGRSAVPVPQSLGSRRWQCSKPEGDTAKSEGPSFKIPGHRPTNFEKKILIWGGRYKNESEIPEIVSYEMVDSAKSKVRVKFSVLMMLLTIVGCIGMVISGKQAAKQQESLAKMNLERKARHKEEAEK